MYVPKASVAASAAAGRSRSSALGDRVYFEPGENHWHGAAPTHFTTHLALQELDDQGIPITRGEHVTDEEYNAAPAQIARLGKNIARAASD